MQSGICAVYTSLPLSVLPDQHSQYNPSLTQLQGKILHIFFPKFTVRCFSSVYVFLFSCSVVSDSVMPCTVARQAPLFMELSRQQYWSGLPFPSPGDLSNPGIEPASLVSPALASGFFTTVTPGKLQAFHSKSLNIHFKS